MGDFMNVELHNHRDERSSRPHGTIHPHCNNDDDNDHRGFEYPRRTARPHRWMSKGASVDDASSKNRFSEFMEEEAKNQMPPQRRPAETTLSTPRQEAHSPARAVRGSLAKVEDGALRRHDILM